MIIGVGTDLVELDRVKRILQQPSGARFMERVLTPEEYAYLETRLMKGRPAKRSAAAEAWPGPRTVEFVAGRFAAKEAVVKALGCGIGGRAGFQDLRIIPEPSGRPVCELSEGARSRLELPAEARIHLSITHSSGLAAAYAVVELGGPGN